MTSHFHSCVLKFSAAAAAAEVQQRERIFPLSIMSLELNLRSKEANEEERRGFFFSSEIQLHHPREQLPRSVCVLVGWWRQHS